jgi:hypothetical protein
MDAFVTFLFGVSGAVLLGRHFGSWHVGVGVYFCIIAAGRWSK